MDRKRRIEREIEEKKQERERQLTTYIQREIRKDNYTDKIYR